MTPSRREASRRYAARRRGVRLAAANRVARVCQRRQGPGMCGGALEDRVNRAIGTVDRVCPRCERRKSGVCQNCPRPVYGRVGTALRCAAHATARRSVCGRAWATKHPELARERARQRYQADPARRERRNAYKRLWRRTHRDQVAKGKRAAGIRHNRAREKMLAWHRRYNAERRAHKAALMTAEYRAAHPVPQPTCTGCHRPIPYVVAGARRPSGEGRPPTRCVFCMPATDLRQAVKRWTVRTDRELATPPAPPPKRVKAWKPRERTTRHNAKGERLCWTEGCPSIVRGREKKCERCRAREQREADAALAQVRGRGRRTDLARGVA